MSMGPGNFATVIYPRQSHISFSNGLLHLKRKQALVFRMCNVPISRKLFSKLIVLGISAGNL